MGQLKITYLNIGFPFLKSPTNDIHNPFRGLLQVYTILKVSLTVVCQLLQWAEEEDKDSQLLRMLCLHTTVINLF